MSSYWKDRFLEEEKKRNKDARIFYSTIEKQYDKALLQLEKDIEYWINRIAENNNVTFLKAKEILTKKELKEFKWDLEEYIENGKENSKNQKWVKELENASARVHIQKLEALKLQIQNTIENLYSSVDDKMQNYLKKIYADTYYHNSFLIAKNIGYMSSFNVLDKKRIDQVILKPWVSDGKGFSERIWKDKNQLLENLHTSITRKFIIGGESKEIFNEFRKNLNERVKNKKFVINRLIQTETAAYFSKAIEISYKNFGLEKYEILATLDTHTSDICQDMDGKVFDMKDYQVGVTAPPFHIGCRSTTVPYFDDEDTEGERIARGEDNKQYNIPSKMTYDEWYKEYVQKDKDTREYEEYKRVISNKNMVESLEKFREIKYNDSEKYKQLQREYTTISKVKSKNWSDTFKDKAIKLYYDFREHNYECSDHFLARFLQRNEDFTFEEVANVLKKPVNYIEIKNENNIRFYDLLRVVTNKDDSEVITVTKNGTDISVDKIKTNKWRLK